MGRDPKPNKNKVSRGKEFGFKTIPDCKNSNENRREGIKA